VPTIADRSTWRLRETTEADRAFLRVLYADAHGADFADVGLSPDTQAMLLEHQFRAREHSWAAYPGTRSSIVLVDEQPAGRLLVAEDANGLTLVDIAVLGELQGRGLGTALLTGLLDEADARELPVTLHVELTSPAGRLYQRLGFVPGGHDEFRVLMRREPSPVPENGVGND